MAKFGKARDLGSRNLQVRILCAAFIFYVRGVIGITAVSKTARLRFESLRACSRVGSLVAKAGDCKSPTQETSEVRVLFYPLYNIKLNIINKRLE